MIDQIRRACISAATALSASPAGRVDAGTTGQDGCVVTVDDVRAVLARLPRLRFHWVEAWLDALDADEMRELVLDARRMIVPQRVAREVLGPPTGP
jgi:hypothetical protein